MKIAFFIKNFYGGGAERVVVNLANELVKRHEVTIIVAEKSGHYIHNLSQDVVIIELSKPSIRQIIFDLPRLSKKHTFDVLVSNLIHENIFVAIGWLFSKRPFPLIKVEHNKISEEMNVGSKTKAWLTKFLWSLTKNIGTLTIGVSRGVCNDLAAKGVKSVKVIYNPILTDSDFSEEVPNIDRDNNRLLFVGRLVHQKNPLLAVRILRRLRAQGGSQTLTIAGEGPLENDLKNQIKRYGLENYVDMRGFVEDTTSLYLGHKFLLLTSEFEGFGNVIVEGAYRGCIPIARDIEFGPREIITTPSIGWLLPSEATETEFATIIENYNFSPNLTETRRELESRFRVMIIAKHYEEIIRENMS